MYQWIPLRLQRKSPKFPVDMENDLRYMLQCIKRTTNWMGRKIQLPPPPPRKKSLGFPTKSEKIAGTKNDITRCTLFADLHARDTQPLPRNFRLFWIPEKSLLKSSVPPSPRPDKEKCAICLPQKIPRSKISNQSKFLVHPRLLKSGVPPPSGTEIHRPEYNIVCYTTCFIFTYFLSSPYSSSVSSCSLNCAQ